MERLLESRLVLFRVVVASLKICFVTSKDSQVNFSVNLSNFLMVHLLRKIAGSSL